MAQDLLQRETSLLQKGPFILKLSTTAHNIDRSSPLEVFLGKGVLKIYSKFIGEHPCRSAISIKLQKQIPTLFTQ